MFQALLNLLKLKPKAEAPAQPVTEIKIEDAVKVEAPKVEEVKVEPAPAPAPAPAPTKPAVKKAAKSTKPKANTTKSPRKKK